MAEVDWSISRWPDIAIPSIRNKHINRHKRITKPHDPPPSHRIDKEVHDNKLPKADRQNRINVTK